MRRSRSGRRISFTGFSAFERTYVRLVTSGFKPGKGESFRGTPASYRELRKVSSRKRNQPLTPGLGFTAWTASERPFYLIVLIFHRVRDGEQFFSLPLSLSLFPRSGQKRRLTPIQVCVAGRKLVVWGGRKRKGSIATVWKAAKSKARYFERGERKREGTGLTFEAGKFHGYKATRVWPRGKNIFSNIHTVLASGEFSFSRFIPFFFFFIFNFFFSTCSFDSNSPPQPIADKPVAIKTDPDAWLRVYAWIRSPDQRVDTIIILFTLVDEGGTCDRWAQGPASRHVAPACRK